MWRHTVIKIEIEIKDLAVKVLEPEKIGDASSDITLPVTFRTRGDLQRWKIIIPTDNSAKAHPAFPVAEDIVDTSFFAIKTYDTNKDKEKNCKRVAREVASQLLAQRKKKPEYDSTQEESESDTMQPGLSAQSTAGSCSYGPLSHSSLAENSPNAMDELPDSMDIDKDKKGKARKTSELLTHSDVNHLESEEPSFEEMEDGLLIDSRLKRRAAVRPSNPGDEFDPEREERLMDEIEAAAAGGCGGESSTIDPEDATTAAPKRRPGRPRGSKNRRATGRKAV
ncbi:hypothetical protein BG006_009373 [Podila minutissima]|uniref:Uncharacterized protein n=1 Tax=Podila minutissima TaxID=64525 RepID=A0A9P5SV05_9FUNG|nr:hypothetical protein BG006_009373 [Podila minutissima]